MTEPSKQPTPAEKAKRVRSLKSPDSQYYAGHGLLPAVPLKAVPTKRPFQYKAANER